MSNEQSVALSGNELIKTIVMKHSDSVNNGAPCSIVVTPADGADSKKFWSVLKKITEELNNSSDRDTASYFETPSAARKEVPATTSTGLLTMA